MPDLVPRRLSWPMSRLRRPRMCLRIVKLFRTFTTHVPVVRENGWPSPAGPAGWSVAPLPGSRRGDTVTPAGFPPTLHSPAPGSAAAALSPPRPDGTPLRTASCRRARVGLGPDGIPLLSWGTGLVLVPQILSHPPHISGTLGDVAQCPYSPTIFPRPHGNRRDVARCSYPLPSFGPLGTRGDVARCPYPPPTRAAWAAGGRGQVLVPPHAIPDSIGHVPISHTHSWYALEAMCAAVTNRERGLGWASPASSSSPELARSGMARRVSAL